MALEQIKRFLNDIFETDDLDFYEEYVIHLSDEEQERFFMDNPDFMSKFLVEYDKIFLLRDSLYREILRKIKVLEK